jgi:hypothetical protein
MTTTRSCIPCSVLRIGTDESLICSGQAIDAWIAANGRGAYLDRLLRGQYAIPDGLGFGGKGPEWSNRTLREIVRTWCGHAERLAVIDWHTGIGGYGEPFFLCFNRPGSELQKRCFDWWGQQAAAPAFSEGEERPCYTGLVYQGIHSLLQAEARSDKTREALRRDLAEAYCPSDAGWRDSVVAHATELHRRTLEGLKAWN